MFRDSDLESGAFASASPVAAAVEAAPTVPSAFAALGLSEPMLRTLARLGHETPTPVQREAIPALIEGHDLLVSAETGSGKTGAFLLPAIDRLAASPEGRRGAPRVLVLAPTRELALQVEQAALLYGRHLRRMRTVSLIGGAPFGPQLRRLSEGVDLVVATPGRLVDHLERGRIDLSSVNLLVLDEADRMLDMGFADEIDAVCRRLPDVRQTVLFSATLDARIGGVASKVARDPRRIEVDARTDAGTLTQVVHHVDDLRHKLALLDAVLGRGDVAQAIVFASTKAAVDELTMKLRDDGRQAAGLHGDMPQVVRDRVVRSLRDGRIGVLVATDVASRGIDVPTISHVVNFDLPMRAEDYVHRIGRTARAGRSGTSITLVGARDRRLLAGIERLLQTRIPVEVLPGLEPRSVPSRPPRRFDARPGPGGRPSGSRPSGPSDPARRGIGGFGGARSADAGGRDDGFGGRGQESHRGAPRRDGPPAHRPRSAARRHSG
ncbi:MAG TPA: DEAD/DEAH box helicase [Burkholderiaceae bacterium]|nr:DEAD/DEAH box helicase [Burkholderiaceae bacterium]